MIRSSLYSYEFTTPGIPLSNWESPKTLTSQTLPNAEFSDPYIILEFLTLNIPFIITSILNPCLCIITHLPLSLELYIRQQEY